MGIWICSELPWSISGVSIYYGTQIDIRVKRCASVNFSGDSMFNFESLNMLWPIIGYQSQKLWPFKFAWRIRVQFRDSRYILGLNRTFDSKVMAVWICEEILRSISTVSIWYRPQSDIRVKTYCNLNLPKASLSNFERRGICWVSLKHPCQKLHRFHYAPTFLFNFERLDILWASIVQPCQKLRPSELD